MKGVCLFMGKFKLNDVTFDDMYRIYIHSRFDFEVLYFHTHSEFGLSIFEYHIHTFSDSLGIYFLINYSITDRSGERFRNVPIRFRSRLDCLYFILYA